MGWGGGVSEKKLEQEGVEKAKGEYGEGRGESKRDRRWELGQQRQTGMDDVVSGDGGLF